MVDDSRKLIEAQKRPERVWVKFFQEASTCSLGTSKTAHNSTPGGLALLLDMVSNPPQRS
jgi:hypothetical protein